MHYPVEISFGKNSLPLHVLMETAAFFIGFPLMMLLFVGSLFGWFYAVGISLNKKLPTSAPMRLGLFKAALLVPAIYILAILLVLVNRFIGIPVSNNPGLAIFAVVIPLHLLSMVGIFYCLYFNAKELKTVELQRPVKFEDFIGEFFLFWFYPVGVWIIQPKLNKIFHSEANANTTGTLE